MATALVKCPDCGKVFAAKPGKIWCTACATNRVDHALLIEEALDQSAEQTPEALAEYTGLPLEEVKHLIRTSPSLSGLIAVGDLCVRCGAEPAQAGADFCLQCRLELNLAFGSATDNLFAKIEMPEYEPQMPRRSGALGLISSLEEKRTRSGPKLEDLAPRRGRL